MRTVCGRRVRRHCSTLALGPSAAQVLAVHGRPGLVCGCNLRASPSGSGVWLSARMSFMSDLSSLQNAPPNGADYLDKTSVRTVHSTVDTNTILSDYQKFNCVSFQHFRAASLTSKYGFVFVHHSSFMNTSFIYVWI